MTTQLSSKQRTIFILALPSSLMIALLIVAGLLLSTQKSVEAAALQVTTTANAGPGSLRQAVTNANAQDGPDTITFSPTLETIFLSEQITVSSDLTIDGGGSVVVDGQNMTRIFRIQSGNATVANIILQHGYDSSNECPIDSPCGSAIKVDPNAVLTLANSSVLTNTADYGGGIYSLGQIAIISSTLSGNSARLQASAIFHEGTEITITNSTLFLNATDSNGIFVGGAAGAIFNAGGDITITNSTFYTNSLVAYHGGGVGGGAISNVGGDIIVSDSTFSSSTIRNFQADNTGGGAIYNSGGDIDIINSTFNNNSNDGDGGAIYNVTGDIAITNSTLSDNSARENLRGGAIYTEGGVAVITNTTFSNNTATWGGGIYNLDGDITVNNSIFNNNYASQGGGIYNRNAITITNSTILGNNASQGGGIYNQADLFVFKSTVSVNAAGAGGGIFNDGGTVTHTDSALAGNSASQGGGIYSDRGILIVTDSRIPGNAAASSGGGIYNNQGTNIVINSTVSDNSVDTNGGGGIYNDQGTTSVVNSTLSGNSAGFEGGGIKNFGGDITVVNSTLSGNSVSFNDQGNGGGIYNGGDVETTPVVTVTNSTLSNNSATNVGGGIYNEKGSVNLIHASITNNRARVGAGIASSGDDTSETVVTNLSASIVAGNLVFPADSTNSELQLTIGTNNSFESSGYNVVGSHAPSIVLNGTNDLIIIEPSALKLTPLADNGCATQQVTPAGLGCGLTHELDAGSPALNLVPSCVSSPINKLDQRGFRRGEPCDAGAIERGAIEMKIALSYAGVSKTIGNIETLLILVVWLLMFTIAGCALRVRSSQTGSK